MAIPSLGTVIWQHGVGLMLCNIPQTAIRDQKPLDLQIAAVPEGMSTG